jgi:TetR/AcrR family transcriptional regulator, transcriptional repressor for nem operon
LTQCSSKRTFCTDQLVQMLTTRTSQATRGAIKLRGGETTREALVTAAMHLMHVHGYNGTSLDDVLRETGVGKGNFYYYFRSKEELAFAILDRLVTGFVDRTLAPCFADAEPPLSQMRCFLDRLVQVQRDLQCRGGCAIGNLASELSDVNEEFRKRLASVFTTWHARLADALAEAKQRGHVGVACDPDASARFLVASLEGAILLTKVTKDIGVMEQCVGELKRYLSAYEVKA